MAPETDGKVGRAPSPGQTGDVRCQTMLVDAGYFDDLTLGLWRNGDTGRVISFQTIRTRGAEWLAVWLADAVVADPPPVDHENILTVIRRARDLRARIERTCEENRGLTLCLHDTVSAIHEERILQDKERARIASERHRQALAPAVLPLHCENTVRMDAEIVGEWDGILVCTVGGRRVGFRADCLDDGTTARHPGERGAIVIPRTVAIDLGLLAA